MSARLAYSYAVIVSFACLFLIACNDGSSGLVNVLRHIGIEPGLNVIIGLSKRDNKRKRDSNANATILAKKLRVARRKAKKNVEDNNLDREGLMYQAGGF